MRDVDRYYAYNDNKANIELNYGVAYFSALAKLADKNRYDENGCLKANYELTDIEKKALLYYINGSTRDFSSGRSRRV